MGIKVKVNGGKNITKFIKDIKNQTSTVEIGFFDGEQATIAAENEYGTTKKVSDDYRGRAKNAGVNLGPHIAIPPRPFMAGAVKHDAKKWQDIFATSLVNTHYDVAKSMAVLGATGAASIQNSIKNGEWVDNAPNTIRIKGFNKPLIDKGTMLQSVTFEVHKK